MQQDTPIKQKIQTFILDIFFGGREYKTQNAEKKKPFPLAAVAITAVSTVLILCTIFSLIRISELSSEIASLKKQTVSLASKQASLENELDHRYSFAEIIEYATKTLGFSENGGRIVYIEPENNGEKQADTNSDE